MNVKAKLFSRQKRIYHMELDIKGKIVVLPFVKLVLHLPTKFESSTNHDSQSVSARNLENRVS